MRPSKAGNSRGGFTHGILIGLPVSLVLWYALTHVTLALTGGL